MCALLASHARRACDNVPPVCLCRPHTLPAGRRECTSVQPPYPTFCREAAQLPVNFTADVYSLNTAGPQPPSRSGSLTLLWPRSQSWEQRVRWLPSQIHQLEAAGSRVPLCPSSPLHPGGQGMSPPTPAGSPNISTHGRHEHLSNGGWMADGGSPLSRWGSGVTDKRQGGAAMTRVVMG